MRNAILFVIYGTLVVVCVCAFFWLFNTVDQPSQVIDRLPSGVYTSTINGHSYIICVGTGITHDESCPNADHIK